MLEAQVDEGDYRISWPGGTSGWVILSYSDRLKVVETQATAFTGHICEADSVFVSYAQLRYLNTGDKLIFAIFEGGEPSFVEARSCLIDRFENIPLRIGFIIADREFLKSIAVNQIPLHIETVLRGIDPELKKDVETEERKP